MPQPACEACVSSVLLPNGEYAEALEAISNDTFTTDQEQLRDACSRARQLGGDPAAARNEALASQDSYLERGDRTSPGGGLLATFELLDSKCD